MADNLFRGATLGGVVFSLFVGLPLGRPQSWRSVPPPTEVHLTHPHSRQVGSQPLRVAHVAMGDLWAGAEVQLLALLTSLHGSPDIVLTVVLFNDGRLAHELRRIGLDVHVLQEGVLPPMDIVRGLVKIFRTEQVDLVHTHKYKDCIAGAVAARVAGVGAVVRTVHGLGEPFTGLRLYRMRAYEALETVTVRVGVHALIAVSSDIASTLPQRFGGVPVAMVHNGVRLKAIRSDQSADAVKDAIGVPRSARVLGTAGRLTPVKGQHDLLQAFADLAQQFSDLHLVIVGDGPLAGPLREAAATSGFGDRIHFTGHRDDVLDVIAAMDVFVLSSHHEGVPMVLLESMALGRAIVATAVGGMPEIVEDGVHGLLVPARSPAALSSACARLLTDTSLRTRVSTSAMEHVRRNFSSDAMASQVLRLYRSVAQQRGGFRRRVI